MQWTGKPRFSLELDPEQEPIAGSLTDEDGTTASFTGWLGLARLVERALRRTRGEPDGLAADRTETDGGNQHA